MQFTREEYESLPARSFNDFKEFVLVRFGDYTKFTKVKARKYWGAEPTVSIGEVDDPLAPWTGWKAESHSLLDDDKDYFVVCAFMQDDRGPTSYYNYVYVPKAFVFGEMEADEDYKTYLRLKERYEDA